MFAFGFWILRLVPTSTSIGLRFVFPSEYLHRLHWFDDRPRPRIPPSSTPTLDIWAPRTRPYSNLCFFSFGLGLHFVVNFRFVYFFYIRHGISSAFVLGSCSFLQHWYWFLLPSFRLMSRSAGLVLVHLFWNPSLNTRCEGTYSLISLFRIGASSTPLFWSFGVNFVIIRRSQCGLHIRLSRVVNVMWSISSRLYGRTGNPQEMHYNHKNMLYGI